MEEIKLPLNKVIKALLTDCIEELNNEQTRLALLRRLNLIIDIAHPLQYKVICDESNNTPDSIDRNELYVDIELENYPLSTFSVIPKSYLNKTGWKIIEEYEYDKSSDQ